MACCEPRRFDVASGLPGAGLPQDRAVRLAARRAFVDMKSVFIAAVAPLPGRQGDWLRAQVRAAEEPMDLLLLRSPLMQALSARDESTRQWRRALRKSLSSLFPEVEVATGFGALTFA